MKRAIVAVLLLLAMAGCGGGSSSSNPVVSKVKNRVFVSNSTISSGVAVGQLELIDGSKDEYKPLLPIQFTTASSGSSSADLMAVTPGREFTLTQDSVNFLVRVVNNTTESAVGQFLLPNIAEDLVAKDANTVYAAVPNGAVSGTASLLGAVSVLDLKNFATTEIQVPRANRLLLSHNGKTLLVFGENSNSVYLIDTTASTLTAVQIGEDKPTVGNKFDQPVGGVFSSDDSTAYIFNCGPECLGTTASVQTLNIASRTVGAAVPVPAVTTGMLNGNTLYVAGTKNGASGAGLLTVLDVSSGAPVVSKADVPIGDGLHRKMALGANNKLFIGAVECTNNPSVDHTGCLSIYDTSASTAVVDNAKGDVTGMVPIAGRNVVYVVEGGELRIYDTTTNAERQTINIIGKAVDVKAIDQAQ